MDIVSGWSDDEFVYLAERVREGSGLRVRRVKAKWSAFFSGLDDSDRLSLQRAREVIGLSVRGKYTRLDFRNRWDRNAFVHRLGEYIDGIRAGGGYDAGIYEADVNPLRRFLSDHGAVNVSATPRLAWFDLETDSRQSFVDAVEFGLTRILCWAITSLTPAGEPYVVATGLLEVDSDAAERKLVEELLHELLEFDVVMAWSGDGFDFPVLEHRARALRAKVNGSIPMWARWSFLDCMEVLKKYHAHVHESGEEKTSFKLNSIAQALLGFGKKEFEASRTWEAWSAGGQERQRLLEYNVQDALLMPMIEAKTGYVALHIAVCSVTRCFPDSRSLMASQQGDGFLLRLGEVHGHRWPTKKKIENPGKYPGAFVMDPTRTGIVNDVHVADFASLYPSIIRSWNISPETILYRLQEDPSEGSCRLPYTENVRFSKENRGMFPLALDQLVARRGEYSRKQDEAEPGSKDWEHYKRLSGAYKIVANSFYGIMGSPFARFFNSTAAEAVTQTGAWLIKRVAQASFQNGLEAFYGDSVTGDRVIVTKDPSGWVQLLPIEQLWDCARGEEVTATGKDSRSLDGWKALAANGSATGWFPITRVLRHEVCKPITRLTTKHGQTEVTEDHGIMVAGREVGPAEFLREQLAFTTLAAPREPAVERIDLLSWLGSFAYEYEYKGRQVVRRFVAHGERQDWLVMDGWGDADTSPLLKRFYVAGSDDWHALLRLITAYVSDGSASLRTQGASRHLLSFAKADFALQTQLASDLRLITRGCVIMGPMWTDTVYVVRSGTLALSAVFAELCGAGSENKHFPAFMFSLDRPSFDVVFKTLSLGDGSIEAETGQFRFTSTSQRLIAGVSYLLSQRGIEHSFAFRQEKRAWTLRTRPSGSERAGRYSIKAEVIDPATPQPVYDLEVEGAHTFVDAVGRVLLHNTDSAFVAGDAAKFRNVVSELNGTWNEVLTGYGCGECHIKLEFEKSFSRIVLVSAKRYIGRLSVFKGKPVQTKKVEIKGLEYKRGDTMRITRQMQKECIDLLMGDAEPTVEICRDFVAGWKERVLAGDIALEDIVLSQSVKNLDEYVERYTTATCSGVTGKTKCMYMFGSTACFVDSPSKCPRCGTERKRSSQPVHVRVARVLAARGEEMRSGTRVEYLIVSDEGAERIEAVPARDPGALEQINRDLYWNKRIYPPTARVLESAFPKEEWVETTRQKKARQLKKKIDANRGDYTGLPLLQALSNLKANARIRKASDA